MQSQVNVMNVFENRLIIKFSYIYIVSLQERLALLNTAISWRFLKLSYVQ